LTSLHDVLLVARFEVLRAVRTWRALALILLYALTTAGCTWIFVKFLGAIENEVATSLGVPRTDKPGAMLDRALESNVLREFIGAMTGNSSFLDNIMAWPLLAVFFLWIGFGLLPFFAASTSAECIAIDVQSRAIRFELLRTGRAELVLGRFFGQCFLTGAGLMASAVAVFGVTQYTMVEQDPLELGLGLLGVVPRAWFFGLPFIGIGVAASQVTASPAWARVLAICATTLTWAAYGLAKWAETSDYPWLADVAMQVLPQGWMGGLWSTGVVWLAPGVSCAGLAGATVVLGYLVFARRDL
jgi:hypothetical protein